MKLSLIFGLASFWYITNANAADLTQKQPYPDTVVYSNGQPYIHYWPNSTGQNIYIVKIQTLFGTNYFDGNIVVWTKRESDNSQIQYIGWGDCNFMGGPIPSPPDNFEPDCFMLVPGDRLVMEATATADQSLYEQMLVSIYIWYRTTPTP